MYSRDPAAASTQLNRWGAGNVCKQTWRRTRVARRDARGRCAVNLLRLSQRPRVQETKGKHQRRRRVAAPRPGTLVRGAAPAPTGLGLLMMDAHLGMWRSAVSVANLRPQCGHCTRVSTSGASSSVVSVRMSTPCVRCMVCGHACRYVPRAREREQKMTLQPEKR